PFTLVASSSSNLAVSFNVVSGPATITGDELTITGTGNVTVEATQSGNEMYAAAESVSRTFTVTKAAQVITFDAIADKVYGDAPFTLVASSSSNLAISFKVVSGPATITGDELTITGTGNVTVEASQAGNDTYAAAESVSRSFKVSEALQVITFDEIADKVYGDAPFTLVASSSSNLAVSFKVVSGPAEITGDELTITGTGNVTVEATQSGNEMYATAEAKSRTFTVAKAAQVITFDAIADKVYGDAPFTLVASSSSNLAVSFKVVSGPATITGDELTITGTGNVTVEATQAGNDTYAVAESVSRTFKVAKAAQVITFDAIADKVYGDAPFTLLASSSSNLAVSFKVVSGPATITGDELTITGTGNVTVEATQSGNEMYAAAEAKSRTFTVAKAVQVITFDAIADKVYGDAAFKLVASSSSNLAVSFKVVSGQATITGDELTITGTGNVTVEATQAGNDTYAVAESVSRTFKVAKAAQVITFDAIADKVYGDAPFTLLASSSSNLAVSFKVVSGPATITGDELTITGTGNVTVEATQSGNEMYAAAEAKSRTFTVAKAAQVITFDAIADKVYGDAPFTLVASSSSDLAVSFRVVSGPATITGDELTITGTGNVTVEAVQAGNEMYAAAEVKSRTFTVAKAAQVITFDAIADKVYGDAAFKLVASSSSNLAVSFNVVSGPATITGDELTITGTGSVTVEATQSGNEMYAAAESVSRTFKVAKAAQVITFDVIADKVYGDAPFTLVASSSSNLAVSFKVVSGPATITGDELTITGTGNVTVEVTQAGNEMYAAAEAKSRTFTVSKAAQVITFDAIADKVYGDAPFTLLASSSSNLAVSFNVVSGPATITGDELTITGTGSVTVEATQSGNEMYAAAESVSRTFKVAKAAQVITFEEIADKVYGDAPFTLVASSSSNLAVSFKVVSGPATITGDELTITGTGNVTVEATQSGNEMYAVAEAKSITFTVSKAAQVITFDAIADKVYGDAPFTLLASSSSNLAVSFKVVSGPATITGDELTITGTGNVTVEATQSGNEMYAAAESVSRTFKVAKAAQVITFEEIADKVYGDAPFTLVASSSSNLAVSFKVVSGPATITGDELTITGTGNVTVEATQSGNEMYAVAEAKSITFTVSKAAQVITFDAIADKVYGDAPFTLLASSSSNLAVSFKVVSGPATITGDELTITGTGNVTVEATQSGNEMYATAEAKSRTFTVAKAAQVIAFDAIADKVYGDAPFTLVASSTSNLAVSFNVVSGPAEITGDELTITGAGNVTVEATQSGNEMYAAAEAKSRTFTVAKAAQVIAFDAIADKVYGDAPFKLVASSSSILAVSFKVVSGPATITGDELTITGAGNVTVEATQSGNEMYAAAEAKSRTFTVAKAAQVITFDAIADKVYGDAPFNLVASSNSNLAVSFKVVSGPATITGDELTITGTGNVTVEAVQVGNEMYAAAESVSKSFTVDKADQEITFDPIEDYVLGEDPINLYAESNSGLEVTFEIVEGEGNIEDDVLTPTSIGKFIVRAIQLGDDNYNYAEATQEFNVDQATGIEDVFAEEMKMYPNPATDFVNLDFPNREAKQISILNAKGQIIRSVEAFDKIRINIQDLSSGMYFISIRTDQFVVTKRLLIVNK
ncbi:T9SS type A sorting domain-containing protein, partial [Marinifilum sp. N1E240]|uniref:T9SS type A sorting domain-containing protein n=1 Tax=Marinifilum sp. N1E240 TaxID=2608082 RepID=UPI00128D108B